MFSTILLVIIYLAFISLGLPDSLLGSAWPSMYGELGVSVASAGIISMTISGATIISSFFNGLIVKKLETGLVTAISVTLTAVSLIGFSLSSSFYMLLIWAVPLGLGAGSVDASLNNFVALNYKARHMNWLHSFWGIGATAGPMIMSYHLVNSGSWKAGYLTIGIIQVFLVLVLICSLPLWKRLTGSREETQTNKNDMKFFEVFKLKGVPNVLLAFLAYCGIEQITGIWGGSYLVFEHNIPAETAAGWIALYFFGIALGRVLCGFLSFKLSSKNLIRIGCILIGTGVLIMLLPVGGYFQLAGLFAVGFGNAPIFPALIHSTPFFFGAENSEKLMGIQMASAYVGTTFMPPIFGVVGQNISYRLMPIFLGVLLVIMLILIELVNKMKKENKE